MGVAKYDYIRIRELYDKGWKGTDIAKKLGCHKATVSKALKKMGLEVAKAAVAKAPKYEKKKDTATEHLLYLTKKARTEIDWIEQTIPPRGDDEYRDWQNQKLKFAAEMRKLISAMADIGYKLFQVEEINEILFIIDEEIGRESEECQKRIRQRIEARRAIRFAGGLNR